MGGKKCGTIGKNCQAVSEVYGQLLMISIVVLSFSTIALTVFSDGGAVDPPHTPHIDLSEKINTNTNRVYITHSGGEAIDLDEIKVVLDIKMPGSSDSEHLEFSKSNFKDPDNTEPDDDVFTLGDCIVIDINPDNSEDSIDIESSHAIDMFFVHIPSKQVIQRTVLQAGSCELPYWITPHPYGSVSDKSGDKNKVWVPTELTAWINDGFLTECDMVKDKQSSETFTFRMDKYEANIKEPLKVFLKVVYITHDESQKNMMLEINVGGPDWIKIADLPKYKEVEKCDQNLVPYNITDKVDTIAKLENLTVRFSAIGSAKNEYKIGWVDFVGIHVESEH